jgi:hypothetical protein
MGTIHSTHSTQKKVGTTCVVPDRYYIYIVPFRVTTNPNPNPNPKPNPNPSPNPNLLVLLLSCSLASRSLALSSLGLRQDRINVNASLP